LLSGSNSQLDNRSNDSKDGRTRNSMHSRGKADVKMYDDSHIVSLKIETWLTDNKSTDTAATVADFLLKATATNCRSATHPDEISARHQSRIQYW
jgi:hypothetical protein